MAIYQLLFFGSSPNSHAAVGYISGHNFWTNQDLGPLSTSKWPSEPQFCERWRLYIWQKNGQKRSYNSHLWVTFILKQSLEGCPGCPFLAFPVSTLGQKYLGICITKLTETELPIAVQDREQNYDLEVLRDIHIYLIVKYILTSLWHWEENSLVIKKL